MFAHDCSSCGKRQLVFVSGEAGFGKTTVVDLFLARLATGRGVVKIGEMLEHVADRLGNTPAIARKSYVHPAVIARVEGQEEWRKGLKLPRQTRWLTRAERGLIAFLEECGTASDYLRADAA